MEGTGMVERAGTGEGGQARGPAPTSLGIGRGNLPWLPSCLCVVALLLLLYAIALIFTSRHLTEPFRLGIMFPLPRRF